MGKYIAILSECKEGGSGSLEGSLDELASNFPCYAVS